MIKVDVCTYLFSIIKLYIVFAIIKLYIVGQKKEGPVRCEETNHSTVTLTMPDSYIRNEGIFTVGAAGVGDAPTVGVLGPQQPSRPYRWHYRGSW